MQSEYGDTEIQPSGDWPGNEYSEPTTLCYMNARNKSMGIEMQAFYIQSFTFKRTYDTHSIPAIITIAEYP